MTRYDAQISLSGTYEARSVRPLEVWKHAGWAIKVYGIAEVGEHPRSEAITVAKRAATQALPRPARTEHDYGIGRNLQVPDEIPVGGHHGKGTERN